MKRGWASFGVTCVHSVMHGLCPQKNALQNDFGEGVNKITKSEHRKRLMSFLFQEWTVSRMFGSHRHSEWQCKQLTDKRQGTNECYKCRSANNRTPEIEGGRVCFLWVTLCFVDQVILASTVRAGPGFKHPASCILQTMKGGRKRRFHLGLLSRSFVPQPARLVSRVYLVDLVIHHFTVFRSLLLTVLTGKNPVLF